MPGAITAQQYRNTLTGAVAQSGMLTSDQSTFAGELAARTGLDPRVIGAWLLAEESGSAAASRQKAGNNDWLNIGYTDSGTYGASDQVWSDPVSAADATAGWLAGQSSIAGYGTASSGIQKILSTAGQSTSAQLHAIQTSGWASGGYPKLQTLYGQIAGSNSTMAQLADAVTAPLTAGGSVLSSVPNAITSVGSGIGSIASSISDIWGAVTNPHNWLRALEIGGAAVAIYLAIKSLTGAEGITAEIAKVRP